MTNKFSKGELQVIAETGLATVEEIKALAKAALAAGQGSKEMVEFRVVANPANILALLEGMDSKPVGCDACGGNGSVDIDHGELGVEHMECPKCYAAPPALVTYPEKLPCPVLLEPGMRFGTGVKTRLLFEALQRRAEYYAQLEKLPSDKRIERDKRIEDLKAMLAPAPYIPSGWKLVPVNPTAEMISSGYRAITATHIWNAMLSASPKPPSIEELTDNTSQQFESLAGEDKTEVLKQCAAARDGECHHPQCPQLRDNEPESTGRHCPIDNWEY